MISCLACICGTVNNLSKRTAPSCGKSSSASKLLNLPSEGQSLPTGSIGVPSYCCNLFFRTSRYRMYDSIVMLLQVAVSAMSAWLCSTNINPHDTASIAAYPPAKLAIVTLLISNGRPSSTCPNATSTCPTPGLTAQTNGCPALSADSILASPIFRSVMMCSSFASFGLVERATVGGTATLVSWAANRIPVTRILLPALERHSLISLVPGGHFARLVTVCHSLLSGSGSISEIGLPTAASKSAVFPTCTSSRFGARSACAPQNTSSSVQSAGGSSLIHCPLEPVPHQYVSVLPSTNAGASCPPPSWLPLTRTLAAGVLTCMDANATLLAALGATAGGALQSNGLRTELESTVPVALSSAGGEAMVNSSPPESCRTPLSTFLKAVDDLLYTPGVIVKCSEGGTHSLLLLWSFFTYATDSLWLVLWR